MPQIVENLSELNKVDEKNNGDLQIDFDVILADFENNILKKDQEIALLTDKCETQNTTIMNLLD